MEPTIGTPVGCSLGFIQGLGRQLSPDELKKIETTQVRGYSSYVTCLMCTTSDFHNGPETEKTLVENDWNMIGTYLSNSIHPGEVRIWIKQKPNGVKINGAIKNYGDW